MLPQNANSFTNLSAERTKRSSNFTTKEVNYLIQLVNNKREVIESKKTDRASSEEKVKAWKHIEEEFNFVFEDFRSVKVLKTKYENLKKDLKRKLPINVSNKNLLKMMKSNEVRSESLSDIDYDLSENENTLSNSNAFDVDTKPPPPLNEGELDAAAEQYVFETLLFEDTKSSTPLRQEKSISKQLKREAELVQDLQKDSIDIWEEVAHKKIKKLEMETKVIEEEWNLKKYKLELEIESVKTENRFKKEKLQLEIELLKKMQDNK